MGQNTEISWCDHTFNPWWGCVEVSALCDHCYAREWAKRYDRAVWGATTPRVYIKSGWTDVMKWQRAAAADGRQDRVFCGSMMDIFEKPMPVADAAGKPMDITTEDLRRRVCTEVVPACPNLLFLFLTKRPGNITKYIPPEWRERPPENVMFGTSVGNQETADIYVPQLMRVKGRRFLSIEPLLGPVDLTHISLKEPERQPTERHVPAYMREWCERNGIDTLIETDAGRGPLEPVGGRDVSMDVVRGLVFNEMGIGYGGGPRVEWVIAGGESGPHARPMHPDWVRTIRDDCQRAKVAFHYKQWGEWGWYQGGGGGKEAKTFVKGPPFDAWMVRVGKKAAGRLLDGVEHNGFPAPAREAVTP